MIVCAAAVSGAVMKSAAARAASLPLDLRARSASTSPRAARSCRKAIHAKKKRLSMSSSAARARFAASASVCARSSWSSKRRPRFPVRVSPDS